MRRIALVLISFFCAAAAHAEVITFDYTGTINTLREYNMTTGTSRSVVTSNIVTGGVRVGDDFHGAFTIDTNVPLYSDTPQSAWYYNSSSKPMPTTPSNLVFYKTGTSISGGTEAANISVQHGPGTYDYLGIMPSGIANANFAFYFYDSGSANLNSLSIPKNINLDAWENAQASLYWADGANNRTLSMFGMLTSVTKVSAVPEPETYAMLLAGLALVSGVAARRKKQLS